MIKNVFLILISLCAFSCSNQRKEATVDNQKLLYDSTQTNDKSFSVIVITTMKLDDEIEAKDLKKFYMIANKDTLALNMNKISKYMTKIVIH